MKRRNKTGVRFRRLWALALAAGLVCALVGTVSAAPSLGAVSLPDASSPKPAVVIQGNVVVNKNKPTGFYELALCVRTARTVKKAGTNNLVPEATYAAELQAALESGKPEDRQALDAKYDVTYYPFQSAAATVHIDLDALTAVTWGSGKPVYSDWTVGAGTAGTYAANDTGYPRGIDMTDPDNLENAALFTSLQKIIDAEEKDGNQDHVSVRLDTAKPDEVTNATALVEGYDAGSNTALLTLTANTTTTKNVIYEVPTPVVVVRFAYDLNRFENTEVGDPADLAATPNESDFWAGLDKNNRATDDAARTALTYLAAGNGSASDPSYTTSDQEAAETSIHQTVWYEHNMASDQVNQETTQFYYYLGAEDKLSNAGTIDVNIPEDNGSGGWNVTKYSLVEPRTAGKTVLADKRSDLYATPGDPEAAGSKYSFFQNLLTMGEKTLRIELVNAETYRKPTGGGGINILFYDWDDSLIGSLIVDGGDVRSQVEEYVEENLVHPALRPSTALKAMGGKLPADGNYTTADQQAYQTLINSLAREYTYRGKYAYQVGGDDTDLGVTDGEDYPLTNKLDYAFTKRVNTAAAYTVSDAGGGSHTETYVLPHKVTDADMVDAALYPYTYGWAVVEDTSAKDKGWKVMYDAKKIEDTWTTIGVGELSNVKPGYYDDGTATAQTLPSGTAKYQAPAFLADEDPHWVDPAEPAQPGMNYTNKYAYQLNSNSSAGYFRFADFSDIDAELEQYQTASGATKNTLIVKAVYEPGESLMNGVNYTPITAPAYTKWNVVSASVGASYRVQMTLERSYNYDGKIYGTTRVRKPVVQQDTTIDSKWVADSELGVDHDIKNPSYEVSTKRTETLYTQVDVDNGEQITFSLALSARQNKVDYILVEMYGANFVVGTQRSYTNNSQKTSNPDWFIPDNYNYYLQGDSNEKDDYFDCEFETKDGSHGFVLYCTLGHMLQQATMYNHGEINDASYESAVDYLVVRDANLRMDISGRQPEFMDYTTLQPMFINAAKACEAHKNDPKYDCWDVNLDCAKLTYHQMQWFILDGGTDIRTVAAADAAKLDFCHLHASCAAALSTVPDTWDEVITAARAHNATDLGKMTTTAIETLTSLRRNANGAQFATPAAFSDAIIDAVAKLDALHVGEADYKPTWWELQYVILNGSAADADAMKSAGQESYWWYDGSTTAPTLPSVSGNAEAQWNFLLQAAKDSYAPVPTLKDGVTNDWTSSVKLNLARTPFNRNDTPDQTINRNWINLTHNLVKDATETINTIILDDGTTELEYIYTHEKFATFEEFRDALVAAVKEADTRDVFPPTWEQVQWYMIKKTWDNDPDGFTFSQTEGWWWKDGNVPLRVSSLTTLLQILEMRDNPQTPDDRDNANKALGKVVADFFDSTVYLRFDKDGSKKLAEVAAAEGVDKDAAAKWAIEKVNDARKAGATTWNQVQYYIINGKLADTNNEMNRQAGYYWWKNGGEGNDIDFSSASSIQLKLNTLMSATIYTKFGDPKAIQSVNNAVGSDVFSFLRLIASTGGKDLLDVKDLETDVKPNAHADATALLNAVSAFQEEAQKQQGLDEYTRPTAYWYQLQYYVLNTSYIGINDSGYADLQDPEKGYWWYDPTLTKRPEPPPPPTDEPNKALNGILQSGMGGTIAITADQWAATGIIGNKAQTGKPVTLAVANKILTLLAKEATLSSYIQDGELKLSWVQVQYYVATAHQASAKGAKAGKLVDHATALAGLKSMGWDTSKFPAGVITE